MKTRHQLLRFVLVAAMAGPLFGSLSRAQESFSGNWEGMFMDDFRTVLQLNWTEEAGFTGFIMMYDGSDQIQDDALSGIVVEETKITFYIQAKKTSFEGTLNEEMNELSGKFTFPDGSRHPLLTRKEIPGKKLR